MFRYFLVPLLLCVCLFSISFGQVPQTLSYQGVLKDAGGAIVPNGNYNLTFRLYTGPSGGSALWTETQTVTVTDGIFNVILGSTMVLTLPFDVPYYLGISVAAGAELTPRILLTSSAYSLNARSVANNAVTTAKIADGAVTQAKLDPAVTLPPGGTAGGDLAGTYPNPTVDGLQGRGVASTAPSTGQVLKWSGTNWAPAADNAGTSVWATSGNDIYNSNTGNVGIGLMAPQQKLHVNGSLLLEKTGPAVERLILRTAVMGDPGRYGILFSNNQVAPFLGDDIGDMYYGFMTVWGDTRVYDARLRVHGRSTANWGVFIELTHDGSNGMINTDVGNLFINPAANVGIGTLTPSTRKLVVEQTTGPNNSAIYSRTTSTGVGSVYTVNQGEGMGIYVSAGSATYPSLRLVNDNASGALIEGWSSSNRKFAVLTNGNVLADGNYTGPADFSEMIAVSTGARSVEPGDVLVIDPNNYRATVKSDQARTTLVAGVYSTKPGFLGSERSWDKSTAQKTTLDGSDTGTIVENGSVYTLEDMAAEFNEIPLAVVGIVPCKVSAENGSIRPGDLLVTSNTPGHAMRDDNPAVGTILGKALEPLSAGTGMIKVLVTLH